MRGPTTRMLRLMYYNTDFHTFLSKFTIEQVRKHKSETEWNYMGKSKT